MTRASQWRVPALFLCSGLVIASSIRTQPAQAGNGNVPRVNYMLHCMGCHGLQGQGNAKAGVPGFAGFGGKFVRVPGGRAFLVQVPGSSQSPLDDGDLADVLNWMLQDLSPAELPENFRPYTAAEVKQHRGKPMDVQAVRAALIRTIDALPQPPPDDAP